MNMIRPGEARRARVLIFVVAYEAESTLESVLARVPDSVFQHDTEILVIDDSSTDRTFDVGVRSAKESRHRIKVLYNSENQGYGGNQKLGFQYAIRHAFDVVVLLHGDGQYAPEAVPALLTPILDGSADAVMGSRMMVRGQARKGGMPLYKYVGNRILTAVQNRLLHSRLSEFHSGFRAYRVDALARIPFGYNTNVFHFDTEILIQLMLAGSRVVEVPIPTFYGDEICRVDGLRYARDVVATTVRSRLHRLYIFYDRKFDVGADANPHHVVKLGYRSSHTAALDAVPADARVLDIGCGLGLFDRHLAAKGCCITGVDQFPPPDTAPFEQFIVWDERQPFPVIDLRDFDYVLLLDMIEHLKRPEVFLDRLRSAARSTSRRPTFIVTAGNVAFLIVRLQALLGNFNYSKRGILDLAHTRLYTFSSLTRLFEQCGFNVERVTGISAPFPKALGSSPTARRLVWLNDLLIRIWRGMFAYQIFLEATPTPSVDALLDDSIATGKERADALTGAAS